MIATWLTLFHLLALTGLSLFGFLGLVTLGFYWPHRRERFPCPEIPESALPPVTIQLPIYNERFVVERLIAAAVQLDYPADRLQIQVLDDSTDDTTEIAAELVEWYRKQNIQIQLLHRDNRQGYKAGALQAALASTTGEFIAVFDADFKPNSDFLRQTIPYFAAARTAGPRSGSSWELGLIQTRWGHLNWGETALTGAQAIAIDKHFAVEQTTRHRAGLFPKFNGSAGIWRRACLEDAGGWQDDTVCEDLCLSTRAFLKGWQFQFLNDVVAPAELPATISAYKNQQSRWAKGSIQCLLKFGPAILAGGQHSWAARLYALFSMASYTTHLFLILLLLVQVPLVYLNQPPPPGLFLFGLAGLWQPLLFVLSQQLLYPDWKRRLRHLPSLVLIAIGLAPSNSRAMLQIVTSRTHPFIRTPKGQNVISQATRAAKEPLVSYRLPFDRIVLAEIVLALYAGLGLVLCVWRENYGPALFFLTCGLGFGYVAWLALRENKNQ
jgi:cellulose synthase/poly-beta-1,6-N-acetylglucosamine synthase-like glycosyltransferase